MPIPSCFENFIGIRAGCGDRPPPRSGLYFEDLEGLRLTQASQMADGHFATGADFLQAKFSFALKQLTEEIIGVLPKITNYHWNAVLETVSAGAFSESFSTIPNPDSGVKITKPARYRSAQLVIEKVSLWSETPAMNVPIILRDGTISQTFYANLEADRPTTLLTDYTAVHPTVFVVWDGNGGQVNDSRVTPENDCGCRDVFSPVKVEGWDGFTTTQKTFGLTAEISLRCDETALMCALAHRLGNVLLYRTGMEVARERLASDRLNYFSMNKDEALRLLTLWEKIYEEKRHYLLTQIHSFLAQYDDYCLTCNAPRLQSILP